MKRVICVLLALAMLFAFAACGADEKTEVKEEPVVSDEAVESTLSPREQFEQQKQAMAELNKGKEEQTEEVTSVTYTTNGITYTLDSSFTSGNEAADSAQHKYTSKTMWITEQIMGNNFGYTSSQEIAEYIAGQKDTRVVGSRNGVYYVEEAANATIKAYYVDDSGYYWIISGFVTGGNDYNAYKDALIDFCTSGKIN